MLDPEKPSLRDDKFGLFAMGSIDVAMTQQQARMVGLDTTTAAAAESSDSPLCDLMEASLSLNIMGPSAQTPGTVSA